MAFIIITSACNKSLPIRLSICYFPLAPFHEGENKKNRCIDRSISSADPSSIHSCPYYLIFILFLPSSPIFPPCPLSIHYHHPLPCRAPTRIRHARILAVQTTAHTPPLYLLRSGSPLSPDRSAPAIHMRSRRRIRRSAAHGQ